MNILIVSHESQKNGATKSMINSIIGMSEYDNVNILVLLPGRGPAEEELDKYNIRNCVIKYYPNYKIIGKNTIIKDFIKELCNFFAIFKINKLINKFKIDIVHSNSSAVDVGARAAKRKKVLHIFHIREFMEEDFNFEYRNKKRMKKLFSESEETIFISAAVQKKYIKLFNIKKYRIIYNGFLINDYYEIRKDLFLKEKIRILLIGTISEGKGTLQAVRTVEKLVNEQNIRQVELYIIGKGEKKYIDKINNYIMNQNLKDYIYIYSYTNELKAIRRNADIALISSKCEAFGRVTIEGMLAGLLVMGTNTGGTAELIKNRFNGLVYQEGNIDDSVAIIKEIIDNKEIYRNMARIGQEWAKENLGHLKNAQKIYDVYTTILSEKIYKM